MAISRQDVLKRIRHNKRVNYDALPRRDEMIDPAPRPNRLFRAINKIQTGLSSKGMTLGEFAQHSKRFNMGSRPVADPNQPLTPTQDLLINKIPQQHNVKAHHIRNFVIGYMSSRDPAALVHHLSKTLGHPIPEDLSFDTSKMGAKPAQEHAKKIEGYVSGLQQHLHRQGDKDYNNTILKAMGDYLDKSHRAEKVRQQMDQHFTNS